MKCFEQKKRKTMEEEWANCPNPLSKKRTTVMQIPSEKYHTFYYIYGKSEGLQKYSQDEIIEMRDNNIKMKIIDFNGNKLRYVN